VLFREVDERHFGVLRLHVPELASVDLAALALALIAMLATFYWKLGLPKTLAACAVLGALVHVVRNV
jgi:chromate transporter